MSINKLTLQKREGFHPEYAHANDFDYASQCAIGTDFARSHSKENTPDQCCGDYPTRFPFIKMEFTSVAAVKFLIQNTQSSFRITF